MLKSISLLLLSAVAALAQVSGVGQYGCNASTTTGTAWNSSTSSNATQTIATNSPFAQWVIVLDETTTLTAGAITVEGDYGDGNFVTVPSSNLFNATTLVQVSNPYTVQASTNVQWILTMGGMKTARIRLSTVITGTGAVTPFFTGLCTPVFPSAVYTTSLPTLSSGQGAQLQLDAKGQQLTDLNYLGGAAIDTNSGNKSAATQRVVLATDQPQLTNKLLVTPDSVALPANQSVNMNQVAGTTADTNSGTKSAGTLRVVLATDQPQLTNKLLVTPDSVALPANQSVNESQINGVTPLMGNGVTGTGSQRVTIASDNTAFSVNAAATLAAETTKVIGTARVLGNGGATLDGAPAATAPTNLVQVGGQFVTSPTTLTTGQAGTLQLTAAQNLKVDETTIAGTAIDTNSGNKSAGTQRMVLATDQPNLTTPLNVALAANQSVNVAQINGVTPLMGNGVTGTGSQRVTIASDNTAFAVNSTLSAETTKVIGTARVIGNGGATLDQAPGSAVPTNALQVGGTDGTNTRVHYMDPCEFSAWTYFPINVSSNTQIVAGSSSKNVYICKMFLAPVAAAANVNIVESATSGNACATSPTGMMGGATAALGAQNAINGGFVLPADTRAWMKTATAADAVCIFASAQVTGVIAYVQF